MLAEDRSTVHIRHAEQLSRGVLTVGEVQGEQQAERQRADLAAQAAVAQECDVAAKRARDTGGVLPLSLTGHEGGTRAGGGGRMGGAEGTSGGSGGGTSFGVGSGSLGLMVSPAAAMGQGLGSPLVTSPLSHKRQRTQAQAAPLSLSPSRVVHVAGALSTDTSYAAVMLGLANNWQLAQYIAIQQSFVAVRLRMQAQNQAVLQREWQGYVDLATTVAAQDEATKAERRASSAETARQQAARSCKKPPGYVYDQGT
jgi:hypothetical protein